MTAQSQIAAMDDSQMLHRMEIAVKNAYEAIRVLKQENCDLKLEIKNLKLKLRKEPEQQSVVNVDSMQPVAVKALVRLTQKPADADLIFKKPTELVCNQFSSLNNNPTSAVHLTNDQISKKNQSLTCDQGPQSVHQQSIVSRIPLSALETDTLMGWESISVSLATDGSRSSEVNALVSLLGVLSRDNVHSVGQAIANDFAKFSAQLVGKTLFVGVGKTVDGDKERISSVTRISASDIERVRLLVSLLGSIASRAKAGLPFANSVLNVVKNMFFAGLRSRTVNPLFGLFTGDPRSVSVDHSVDEEQQEEAAAGCEREAAERAELLREEAIDDTPSPAETAALVMMDSAGRAAAEERKAELFDLFGFGDSDAEGSGTEEGDTLGTSSPETPKASALADEVAVVDGVRSNSGAERSRLAEARKLYLLIGLAVQLVSSKIPWCP